MSAFIPNNLFEDIGKQATLSAYRPIAFHSATTPKRKKPGLGEAWL